MIDHRIAEMSELLWDVAMEAARRFGAKKANVVIGACTDALRDDSNVRIHVQQESGIEITDEDIEFIRTLVEADDAMQHAKNIIKKELNKHGR